MHHGWVRDVTSDAVWVCLSFRVTGRVEALEASDDLKVVAKLKRHFAPGDAVRVRVVAASKSADGAMRLDLSLREHLTPRQARRHPRRPRKGAAATAAAKAGAPAVGTVVPVRVLRARPGRGLDVLLSGNLHGRAPITEICDDWVQEPLSTFEPQQYTKAVVLLERRRRRRLRRRLPAAWRDRRRSLIGRQERLGASRGRRGGGRGG